LDWSTTSPLIFVAWTLVQKINNEINTTKYVLFFIQVILVFFIS